MTAEIHRFSLLGESLDFDPSIIAPDDIDPSPRYMNSLALDVSGRCNMRCAYCAESATLPERERMPQHVTDLALKRLFESPPEGVGVSVHLGSGEPLLCPDAVIRIGQRARSLAADHSRPLSLYLTTNGTMLDDHLVRGLVEGRWNVKVSIDGAEDLHDRYRRDRDGEGTFRRIEPFVRALSARMPERFSTTSVLCRGSDPGRVFNDIASLGVKNIEMVPAAVPGGSPLSLRGEDTEAYGRFMADYVLRLAKGEDLPVHIRFRNRLQKTLGYGTSSIPCGAGRNFIAAGPDGLLYPCFRFMGLDDYVLGDLQSGPSHERVRSFMEGAGRPCTRRECSTCWAWPLCGGPCFACAELIGGGAPAQDYCSMVRQEAEAGIWLASVLQKENPRRLIDLMNVELPI